MSNKALITLNTGMEDPETVTVAFLQAVAAAEAGRPTLVFLSKEATRLAQEGTAVGAACDGCPPLPELIKRFTEADGRCYVCPVCFNARQLDKAGLIAGAEIAGTVPLWEWVGDDGATALSY